MRTLDSDIGEDCRVYEELTFFIYFRYNAAAGGTGRIGYNNTPQVNNGYVWEDNHAQNLFEGAWIPSRNLSVSGNRPFRFAEEQVSLDLGPNRAVLSTSRRRYQEVPQLLTTEHPPAISTTHLFHKGDEHVCSILVINIVVI